MVKYREEDQKSVLELSRSYMRLDKISKQEQLDELVDLLHFHEWKYYINHDPIISDPEYDQLFDLLKQTEKLNPEWARQDSPTQRVSSDLSADFPTVKHLSPMLSLANSYNENDLRDFDKQIRKLCELDENIKIEYVVEPKYDGGTIVLDYEGDCFVRGATRGNGEEGDDISNNLKTIRSIPLKAAFSSVGIGRAEVRGEAIIKKLNFQQLNQKRVEEDLPLFANPRNAATGGLRTKDPTETASRSIEAFVYQVGYAEDFAGNVTRAGIQRHSESIKLLEKLGFKVPAKELKVCMGIDEVIEFCLEWQEKRDSYPYEIDGMVIKLNVLDLRVKAGYTSHHPRWAIAFKFKAKQSTSKLLNVEYQVGKIGTITPVAKVEPVQLAGVTVSSVSLHNEDFITERDLHVGDIVLIERAGDVIPYIVKGFPEMRDGTEVKIEFPEFCPVNTTDTPVKLVRSDAEAAWRCPACVCGKQPMQQIIFFVSKDAMNIDGMGKSIVERFVELGWIKDISDIYDLDYDEISSLEGFGQRSAEKLKSAIDKSRNNPIYRLLYGLGIHHLGGRTAKILAASIKDVRDLKDWSLEDLESLKDIGPVLASNVVTWFSSGENVALLDRMEQSGVNLKQTEADKPIVVAEDAPLNGKTILFTGTLHQLKRKEAQKMAEQAGARNISAVSSKLDILVVGEKAGSKLKKAQALGSVQIMTENEFLELMNA